MSVISQVSVVEGCPLSGVPLYMYMSSFPKHAALINREWPGDGA